MLYSGKNQIANSNGKPSGQFITIAGERFYEITDYDRMQPFFISLASDTDLWMYLASTGGLSCGRRSPETALFPYYTDDKITEQYEQTGPKTILRVKSQMSKDESLWEPFSYRQAGAYDVTRKIAKSTIGNKIVFCEENHTLGLRFSYLWCSAGKYGWVRRATLENLAESPLKIEVLDGLQNVLPAGVNRITQNTYSTLVDGYKKTELEGNVALFRMEAIMVDRAEPSESLRCNTIACLGVKEADFLLSSRQLTAFRKGMSLQPETESKGVRGAIFVHHSTLLNPHSSKQWYFLLDVEKDAVKVRELLHFAKQNDAIEQIEKWVEQGAETLKRIVAQNDGVQHTADEYNDARHFANTLFNTMRGGFYLDNYTINGEAFKRHILLFNKPLADKHAALLDSLPENINLADLQELIHKIDDPQLERLLSEYLPITFGRRHGDPSRPWNLFNIRVQDDEGNPIVSYQGNWRDIFQNWEALSISYPLFVNSIISKFLNATTVDGYNPYKVTSEGIDWEVIVPEDPWSNIGYWGDHQIIYLLKLLELSFSHDEKALRSLLNKRQFAFANVPYRLKSYNDIVADPKNSITFDADRHQRIYALIPEYGQDARLVLDNNNEVLLTTMADKLLITLLAKLSNFIPEAGIWMNTLRPEWNDANNALVGYGASMVTLYYIRRYVHFLQQLFLDTPTLILAEETQQMLLAIQNAYPLSDKRQFVDAVGKAGEQYREKAYAGLSGKQIEVQTKELLKFLQETEHVIDDSIRKNKREDGLYHAYNLIQFTNNGILVEHLYQMLEGQVAVLSSGILHDKEVVDLLDAMRRSPLYREDQRSYMLYPARRRKTFLELNNIPQEATSLPVVRKYLGTILKQDRDGGIHFDAAYRNAEQLPEDLKNLYEQVFNHHAFTGRSGTFYKYEGLGCIYWHMVSKLLLAVGECIANRKDISFTEESVDIYRRLKAHYNAIREGIGSHKSPEEYGSFPFDAYSHTPSMAGVQQPGMTGQVKEDILSRFFELGVRVDMGQISFNPHMLADKDFFSWGLSFSYCAVPVIYRHGDKKEIIIETEEGVIKKEVLILNRELSSHIFARDGYVKQLIVTI